MEEGRISKTFARNKGSRREDSYIFDLQNGRKRLENLDAGWVCVWPEKQQPDYLIHRPSRFHSVCKSTAITTPMNVDQLV